ncbi:MAG: DNA repair protein RecO, partial [Parvibaculales bacterium]
MRWQAEGYVLALRKHGESGHIVELLTYERGRVAGFVRRSRKNENILQMGNLVSATWSARLAEHLGNFSLESRKTVYAKIADHHTSLLALESAAILSRYLPENHAYPRLYTHFTNLIEALGDSDVWREHYVRFEWVLLEETGFGLDLSECAGGGGREDLIYIPPKSGQVVSREKGAPWAEKLLLLPEFLRDDSCAK